MSATHLLEAATRLAALPRVESMSDPELLDAVRVSGELARLVEAILAEQVAALASRSVTEVSDGVARVQGFTSVNQLIQHLAKIDHSEAARLIRVGSELGSRTALTGESLPAAHPHLTDAFSSGAVTVGAAELILTTLNTVTPHLPPDEVDAAEQLLVSHAGELSLRQLRILTTQLVSTVDPDGTEPVEESLRERSSMSIRQLADGRTSIRAVLGPEQAGFVVAAVNAKMTPRRHPHFTPTTESESASEEVVEDSRAYGTRMADAFTQIAKDSLTLDDGTVAGAPVTVLITMTLDQLVGAGGVARIDGIDQPISAATARRMAADADLIPVVLGTDSEVLDLGRRSRLATTAQRRALGVRDQGCIWGHCDRPPSHCDVAHLTPWATGGPTDLTNLALMCRFHHTLFDTHHWTLHWDHGTPWLIPPVHVDPHQVPRRAGPRTLTPVG